MSKKLENLVTLADVADHHATVTPDQLALADESLQLTWDELRTRTQRLASRFLALGISRGDRVLVVSQNRPEVIEAQLACARIGAVFTPINTRLSEPEIRRVVELVEPSVVLHDSTNVGRAGQFVTSTRTINFDGDSSFGYKSLVQLPTKVADFGAVEPDTPAMMIFTSGTTGDPLGAVLTHEQLAANHRQFLETLPIHSDTVNYAVAPLFHVAGLNTITGPTLVAGGTSVFARCFDPQQALRHIEAFDVTSTFMVPTMWRDLVESPGFQDGKADRLEFGLVGGASCPPEVERAVADRGIAFFEGYGMTEAGPMVTLRSPDAPRSSPQSVGVPGPEVELRVVDDQGSVVKDGAVGELQVRAPNIMSHYWRNREATEAVLCDGWLSTGDLGYLSNGQFNLLDRKDDMINSGAEKVFPSEVEALLTNHPSIADVAIVGTSHPRWGQAVTAVVVPSRGKPDLESIHDHLAGRIARYKFPRRLEIVGSLPRNGAGKVLRRQVEEMVAPTKPKAS